MSEPAKEIIVIHYGEIALKCKNRIFFEIRLKGNIKKALHQLKISEIKRLRGRLVVNLSEPGQDQLGTEGLQRVFGISHFSFGVAVEKDIEVIKETAWALLENKVFDSFKIDTRRAQKDFPLNSMEVNKQVGAFVQKNFGKKVDLSASDITCYI